MAILMITFTLSTFTPDAAEYYEYSPSSILSASELGLQSKSSQAEGNYSYKVNQPKNKIPKYPSEWGFEIETEEFHVVKSLMIPGTNH